MKSNVSLNRNLNYMLLVLKTHGIDADRNWMYNGLFSTLNTVIVVTSMALVSYGIYSRPWYQMNVFNVAMILFGLAARQVISVNLSNVLDLLQQLNRHLDTQVQKLIRKFDLTISIIITVCYTGQIAFTLFDTFVLDSRSALKVGFKIKQNDYSALLEILALVSYLYYYNIIVIMVCFYCFVQYVFIKHAQACHLFFVIGRLHVTTSDNYLKYCQLMYTVHVNAKRHVNKLIGFIPFAYLGITFVFIVVAISHMIIHKDTIPRSFLLLNMVPALGVSSLILAFIIHFACNATDEFKAARLEAVKLTFVSGSSHSKLHEQKASLYRLIALEKPVNATAWGIFNINRQLLLNFANAVIPFAVMIITVSLQ